MNILVTGGTGFIGSHLIDRLLLDGHSVILLKRSFSPIWRIGNTIQKIQCYDTDQLTSTETVFIENKIDAVVHLAAQYVKYDDDVETTDMIVSNIQFPAVLMRQAIKHHVPSFINTGTFFEYEPTLVPIDEQATKQPFNYYTATKIAFEHIVSYEVFEKKIKAVTLKLFSPYGEKDNNKIVRFIIESFLTGNKAPLTAGEQQLSFTYVQDIVDAYMKALNFLSSDIYSGYESFNIGTPTTHSIRDIIRKLEGLTGKKSNLEIGKIPYNPREIMSAQCNPAKAMRLLGWEARTTLDEGLDKTFMYYKNTKSMI